MECVLWNHRQLAILFVRRHIVVSDVSLRLKECDSSLRAQLDFNWADNLKYPEFPITLAPAYENNLEDISYFRKGRRMFCKNNERFYPISNVIPWVANVEALWLLFPKDESTLDRESREVGKADITEGSKNPSQYYLKCCYILPSSVVHYKINIEQCFAIVEAAQRFDLFWNGKKIFFDHLESMIILACKAGTYESIP